MALTYDPAKRAATLAERGLDFADAGAVLDGPKFQFLDERNDYGEERITTVGLLNGDMTIVVWTRRDGERRIISMRRARSDERSRYEDRLG